MAPTGSKAGRKQRARGNDPASATGAGAASNSRAGAGQPLIDLDFVRGLISAVDESGIDSLEISRAGTRIRVSKTPAPGPVAPAAVHPPVAHVAAPPAALPPAAPAGEASDSGGEARAAASGEEKGTDLYEVKSPMVGTFYRGPAPEAPPYTEVGSSVSKGQTLCILEAMKLMNELESEVDGVVREVLVENAEPVEYGQVLFRVELTGSSGR